MRRVLETAAGTFPTNPALTLLSKETTRVKLRLGKNYQKSVDIDDVDVDSFFSPNNEYGLELEYRVYDTAAVTDFIDRDSRNLPKPYSFEIIPNQDDGAGSVQYYRASGWRAKTVTFEGGVKEPWLCKTLLVGGKIADPVTVDPGIGTGSRQNKSAIAQPRRLFRTGAITRNGAAFATLLRKFTAVCEHGTEAGYTTGDADPVAAGVTALRREFTGTAEFTLDDGASALHTIVKNETLGDIVVPFGASGQPKFTWQNALLDDWEPELSGDENASYANVPWRAPTFVAGVV